MTAAPLIVGALAVLALVGSLVGASTMSAPALGSLAPSAWDERVQDLVAFVEDERGLEFEYPVRIDFMTEEEFVDELGSSADEASSEQLEAIEDFLPMMRSLGLMAGDFDILDTMQRYSETAVQAFYNDDEERIVVPTTDPTPAEEVTLVHELTHALQDQHFDLGELLPDQQEDEEEYEDRSGAILALVEGDANRIASAYEASLPPDEQREVGDAAQGDLENYDEIADEVPSVVMASSEQPYALGEPLVSLIAADGGNEAVDRAFGDPPTTSIELIDPRHYFAGDDFPELDPPGLPGRSDSTETVDEGEFDALFAYYVLAERIDMQTALAAAETWNGGSYVTYDQDGQICTRIEMATGDGDDGERLTEAFTEWVEEMPSSADATIEVEAQAGGGRPSLVVESCDPGPDVDLPNDRIYGALGLLVMRSYVAQGFVEYRGADLDEAWSVAVCAIDELPPGLFDDFGEDPAAAGEELQEYMPQAVQACE